MRTDTPARKPRARNGKVPLLLAMPPALVQALKDRAKVESQANGGPIRKGGKGNVTVSNLVERIIRERFRPKQAEPVQN